MRVVRTAGRMRYKGVELVAYRGKSWLGNPLTLWVAMEEESPKDDEDVAKMSEQEFMESTREHHRASAELLGIPEEWGYELADGQPIEYDPDERLKEAVRRLLSVWRDRQPASEVSVAFENLASALVDVEEADGVQVNEPDYGAEIAALWIALTEMRAILNERKEGQG